MKLNKFACTAMIMITITFCGCGSKQYAKYEYEVKDLYEKIVSTDVIINNIDPDSDDSLKELYQSLDSLKETFEDFENVNHPKEFKDNKKLAESAVNFIEYAEADFHKAFDDEYDDASFQEGMLNYNEVIKCVNLMGEVLQQNGSK